MDTIRDFGKGLSTKKRVYRALVLRFVILRYGRENIGFMWVFVEPMLLCLGVMVLWTATKGTQDHGLHLASVVYTGYMLLTLWRHQTGFMVWAPRVAKNLAQFQGMTMLDVLLSKLFLEFVSVSGAALLVYMALHEFSVLPEIYDLGLMLAGWFMMCVFGIGAGLMIAALSEFNDLTEKLIQPFQYFMLPLSGCFYMLEWLPERTREKMSYLPWIHAFETFRGGFFGPTVPTHGNVLYGYSFAAVWLGVGFFLIDRVKDRINP